MSGNTRIDQPVWREHAEIPGPGLRAMDRHRVSEYAQPATVLPQMRILSRVRKGIACVYCMGFVPVLRCLPANLLMNRSFRVPPSAVQHRVLPVDQSSRAPLLAAPSVLSSTKANDVEIAASRKGSSCFISPLLKAHRSFGWACFLPAVYRLAGGLNSFAYSSVQTHGGLCHV